jgi:hypothetical protein
MTEPDAQDLEKIERDYCAKHKITSAEFHMNIASDTHFAAEMYRLAVATKLIREVEEKKPPR